MSGIRELPRLVAGVLGIGAEVPVEGKPGKDAASLLNHLSLLLQDTGTSAPYTTSSVRRRSPLYATISQRLYGASQRLGYKLGTEDDNGSGFEAFLPSFRYPNDVHDSFATLMAELICDMKIWGEAFILFEDAGLGGRRHVKMTRLTRQDTRTNRYLLNPSDGGGGEHFLWITSYDDRFQGNLPLRSRPRPPAPLESALTALWLHDLILSKAGLYFRKDVGHSIVSFNSPKGETRPAAGESADKVATDLQQNLREAQETMGTGIFAVAGLEADVKALHTKPPSFSPSDLAVAAARASCAAFGVSAMSLGLDPSASTFSNLESSERQLYSESIVPIASRLCNYISRGVAEMDSTFDTLRISVDLTRIESLAGANKDTAKVAAVVQDVLTLNERRALLGYPPIEGGDKIIQARSPDDNNVSSPPEEGENPVDPPNRQ